MLEFGILGPLRITADGVQIDLNTPKLRTLLILLLLDVGRAVSVDRLIDDLWAGDPPEQALVSLRSYVSNLRRVLGRGGAPGDAVLVTRGKGYALEIDPESVDAARFERLVAEARGSRDAGDLEAAAAGFDAALKLWHGDALADVAYESFAQGTIARLEEQRLSVEEDRLDVALLAGRVAEVVPALDAFVAAHPLRERPRAQLMLALHRAGRAPDALTAFREFRSMLADELGLDPSPLLQRLADDILRQDPALDLAVPPPQETVAPAPPRTASPRPPALLVDRDKERARLDARLERLAAGRGGLLIVGGEPGIGKSALLDEFARLAADAGATVHWGRCSEADGAPAFWPWIQVLRSLSLSVDDEVLRDAAAGPAAPVTQLVDDIADRIGVRYEITEADPDAARFLLYDGVASFLGRLAGTSRLVLLLDDVHWADGPSLELLAFLAPRLAPSGILVGVSYRDLSAVRSSQLDATLATVVRERGVELLTIGGLSLDAVAEVVRDVIAEEPEGALVTALHERTAGNPFFVRQLASLLNESPASADAFMTIPPGIRHVIIRRIQLLPPDVRQVLEAAAVNGHHFDARVIAAAADLDVGRALDLLDIAVSHGLVTRSGTVTAGYRFVHALVNETVYDELSPGRAAHLHAAVGQALEAGASPPVEELAEHFWRAADLVVDDRPVHYNWLAANEALRVLAFEQGEHYLRRALHLLSHSPSDDPTLELQVRLRLLQVLTSLHGWTAPEIEKVAGRVREIVDLADMDPDLISLWWSLWTLYMTRGDLDTAQQLAARMLAAAEAHEDPTALVAAHVAVAYTGLHGGADLSRVFQHVASARRWEEEAPAERLTATPEQHLGVSARVTEALACAHTGDREGTFRALDEAVAITVDLGLTFGEAYARMFAGWAAAVLDDAERCVAYTEPGLELCERFGFRHVEVLTVPTHGWACARRGADAAEQAARIGAAVDVVRGVRHFHALPQWLVLLADVHLLAGAREDARACLEEARAIVAVTGEVFYDPQFARLDHELVAP